MRAVRIHAYGGPEVLRLDEVAVPVAADGQVVLRVKAASINPIDCKMRSGAMAAIFPMTFPRTLGRDCAGETPDGTLVAGVGDPRLDGTHADYVSMWAKNCAPVPAGLDAAGAASLCVAGLSAYIPLVESSQISKGSKVLIHAGAGGVGSIAIQIARHLGAEVTTTASDGNRDYCLSLGATRVVDYRTEEIADTDFDVVLDTIGGGTHLRSMDYLKPGGILVALSAAPVPPVAPRAGIRVAKPQILPNQERLATLFQWAATGAIRPQVTATFPLAEAAAAYAVVESGHARGKTVILP